MTFAINVPQSKSVSIAFISLKSMILGFVLTLTSQSISLQSENQHCNSSVNTYLSISKILFLLGIIIDLFSFFYFYLNKQFKKIEYYIFYIYHWGVSLICIFVGFNISSQTAGCSLEKGLFRAITASAIILQANILVTMIANLFIVLKYLHFGSNLTWFFLWTATFECMRIDIDLIAIIHAVLAGVNVLTLVVYKFGGKTTGIVKFWKCICIVSILLMLFCFLIVLIGLTAQSSCQQGILFEKTYIIYGPFELLSPILIMIFLRNQAGDPREQKIHQLQQIFANNQEHQFIDFTAKI